MNRVFSWIVLLTAAALPPAGALAQELSGQARAVSSSRVAGETAADILTRLIGQKVGERLGQAYSRRTTAPGRSGMLGLAVESAQAPADGYTIGCGQWRQTW
jgi:hypothetical protein